MTEKKKHYVFSARTTEEGLKILNDLKEKAGVGWDGLILDAIDRAYNVTIPRIELTGPSPEERAKVKAEKEAAKAAKAKEREDVKKAKADEKAKRQKAVAKKKAAKDKAAAEKKAKKEADAKAEATEISEGTGTEPEPSEQSESSQEA